MATGTYDIVAGQGETFNLSFTVDNDGTVWNLSTYIGRMQVRQFAASTTTALDLSTTGGDITMSALGVVEITVSATEMAAVADGRYVYDFEVESTGGEVTRLIGGKFIVTPEVTR
jgi:Tfp pilus assembly PilM family ATPase